jgi:type VI secretion system secreted protein Hcp
MKMHTAKKHHLGTAVLLACVLAGILTCPTMGAVFAKYDGIDGESVDDDHKDWIDILSFGHSIFHESAPGSTRASTSRTDLILAKRIDKASPKLALASCTGQHFGKVELEVTRSGPKPVVYLKIKLTDVTVSSYAMTADQETSSDPDPVPTEEITLNYTRIEWTYIQYDKNGRPTGEITSSWNFATGGP